MYLLRSSWLCCLFLVAFAISPAVLTVAQDDEEDWLENYYKNPTPEQFVNQMKDWADDGTLDIEGARPALIAFISQLIRQNRDELSGWYESLRGLSPDHRQILHTAMLFSRTKEADEIMREAFGRQYDEQKVETKKILEMPLDKKDTLQMLWGFFYATGSEAVIRRIAVCFRFEEAPDNPDGVDVPDGYLPFYKALPEFAHNSLLANARRHPKLVEILETLAKDDSLSELERNGVYDVLSELDSEKYPPRDLQNKRA